VSASSNPTEMPPPVRPVIFAAPRIEVVPGVSSNCER